MPPDTVPAAPPAAPAAPAERVVANSDRDAADLMAGFIAPGPEARPPAEGRDQRGRFVPKQDAQPPDGEQPLADDAEGGDPNNAKVEGEDAPQDGDEQTIEIDPEAPLFDIKVKGLGGEDEERKVSLKDLRAGYMMNADYVRKTQALANDRKTLVNSSRETVETERKHLGQAMQVLQELVMSVAAPELQGVDWVKLATEQPAEHVRLFARQQQIQRALAAIGQKQKEMTQRQTEDAEKAKVQAAEESVMHLKEAIPTWNDETYQSLMQTGVKSYGYTPEEMSAAVDHRFFKLLNDANAHRAMQAGKSMVDKKLREVPKVPIKTGARQPIQNQGAIQLKQARERLKTDKTVDAAADLMRHFVGGGATRR